MISVKIIRETKMNYNSEHESTKSNKNLKNQKMRNTLGKICKILFLNINIYCPSAFFLLKVQIKNKRTKFSFSDHLEILHIFFLLNNNLFAD